MSAFVTVSLYLKKTACRYDTVPLRGAARSGRIRLHPARSFRCYPHGMDRILTASAAHGTLSLVAGVTTRLVAEARERHALAPTASAAVGRLLTAAALLGAALKGRERLTLQIVGAG